MCNVKIEELFFYAEPCTQRAAVSSFKSIKPLLDLTWQSVKYKMHQLTCLGDTWEMNETKTQFSNKFISRLLFE